MGHETPKSKRIRIRPAGAALLTLMVGLAGCVLRTKPFARIDGGPGGRGRFRPRSSPRRVCRQASRRRRPACGRALIGFPGDAQLGNRLNSIEVFGWSRGYVGFSIQPTNDTGYPNPTVVSYYSADGTHWKEGQTLDTAFAAGTQGQLWDIRSVIEGPAGLLAVGWSGCTAMLVGWDNLAARQHPDGVQQGWHTANLRWLRWLRRCGVQRCRGLDLGRWPRLAAGGTRCAGLRRTRRSRTGQPLRRLRPGGDVWVWRGSDRPGTAPLPPVTPTVSLVVGRRRELDSRSRRPEP